MNEQDNVNPASSLRERFIRDVWAAHDRGGKTAANELLGKAFDEMATDDVTDLFTPRIFNRILAQIVIPRMRRSYQKGVTLGAVAYIDIDFFKHINAMFGHAGGDEVLRVIGKKLKAQFRSSDVIGRVGGDEFVVIADGLTVESVTRRIGILRQELLEHPWKLERIDGGDRSAGHELTFTSKVVDIATPEVLSEIITKADVAVMQEKQRRDHAE